MVRPNSYLIRKTQPKTCHDLNNLCQSRTNTKFSSTNKPHFSSHPLHADNLTDSLPSIADTVTHRQNGDNKPKPVLDSSTQTRGGQTSMYTGDRRPAAYADGHVALIDRPQRSGAYQRTCCRLTSPWLAWPALQTPPGCMQRRGQGLVSA